jgi:hypothetical protein
MYTNGVLCIHKEEWNPVCKKMDGTEVHHVKWNKPVTQRHMSEFFSKMQNLEKKKRDMKVQSRREQEKK